MRAATEESEEIGQVEEREIVDEESMHEVEVTDERTLQHAPL